MHYILPGILRYIGHLPLCSLAINGLTRKRICEIIKIQQIPRQERDDVNNDRGIFLSATAAAKPKKYDLTQGPIFKGLIKLSVPIMATSLMQTAHNLIGMFWLGMLGSDYIAAAGLAGQFLWLSMAFIFMCRIGTEIGVSQNMGKGDVEAAKLYSQNGFMLAFGIGTIYGIVAFVFRGQLIGFFSIPSDYVADISARYLAIIALCIPFQFGHFLITGIYNGFGNTKIPMYINTGALVINIILSPIFIFVLGFGVYGAAIALVVAQILNFAVKIWAMTKYKNRPFKDYVPFAKIIGGKITQILRWGLPVGGESFIFTILFMIVSRLIVSEFGPGASAAHSVALQVESMSFMVGGGFASAVTAFVGQNFGARKWGRLRRTFRVSTLFMAAYGLFVTIVLFFFADPLMSLFLDCPEEIRIGGDYLRIIAATQLLFCMEGAAIGSFRGRGQTMKPAVASVVCNIIRVLVAYILATTLFGFGFNIGITGVWIGIAVAVTLRAVWVLIWHKLNIRSMPKVDAEKIEEVKA